MLPGILFLRSFDLICKTENLNIKTCFTDLNTKNPKLYTEVHDIFFSNQIDLYSVDKQSINMILTTYDNYLMYLTELATVQSILAEKQFAIYSINIDVHISRFFDLNTDLIDFYEIFSVNCLYSFLEFIVKNPVHQINFTEKQTDFFTKLIVLVNYFCFINKVQKQHMYHFKMITN